MKIAPEPLAFQLPYQLCNKTQNLADRKPAGQTARRSEPLFTSFRFHIQVPFFFFCFNALPLCPILLFPQRSEPVCVYHSSFVVIAAMMLIIPRVHHTRHHPHCRPRPQGNVSTLSLHPVNECLASPQDTATAAAAAAAGQGPVRITPWFIQTCVQQQKVVLRPLRQASSCGGLVWAPA